MYNTQLFVFVVLKARFMFVFSISVMRMWILCSDEHPQKAPFPIVVTLFGMSTLCSDKHLENANSPIVVTLLGISMLCSDEHPLKELSPIVVTLLGILYSVTLFFTGNFIIVFSPLS
jgi:hypothetical protein